MGTALLYGTLASSSFIIAVLLGLFTKPPRRLVAGVIAFGAGVLVSGLTFDLMREALESGGSATRSAGSSPERYLAVGFACAIALSAATGA
ncbi:MAG: hypothetical protein M3P48_08995 [Actinomycetota bacterium]|nr:hypothetical protein [Actinomycetota bacterium]